jgi:hypothetical protein
MQIGCYIIIAATLHDSVSRPGNFKLFISCVGEAILLNIQMNKI